MSAHNIFQRAFQHAQLTRPPDDYYYSSAYEAQLEEQHEALPMDDQALLTILKWYGLDDEAGFFICRNYPQLAAKINPTLAAGLGPFDPRLSHEDKFRKNYVINLAQAALDGLEVPNLAPATPKAENRTASTVKLRAEIKGGNIIWRAEPDTQSDQETRSESKPASEKPLEKSNSEPAFPTKVTNDREAKDEEEADNADINYHTQDSTTSPSGLPLRSQAAPAEKWNEKTEPTTGSDPNTFQTESEPEPGSETEPVPLPKPEEPEPGPETEPKLETEPVAPEPVSELN